MVKKFHYSPVFDKHFRELPHSLREEVIEELKLFAEDPTLSHFRIHPLGKKFTGWLSLSIDSDLRIVFKFIKKDNSEVILHDVGSHEIYQ